jgi:Kef-type K+ transport system membrane component KefB
MLPVLGIVARIAILGGMAFIFSKTVPRMPNTVCRFVFLFALCVPLNFVVNYFDVRLLGYHKMSWTGAIIIALLLAAYGMFSLPQPHNPNTP